MIAQEKNKNKNKFKVNALGRETQNGLLFGLLLVVLHRMPGVRKGRSENFRLAFPQLSLGR